MCYIIHQIWMVLDGIKRNLDTVSVSADLWGESGLKQRSSSLMPFNQEAPSTCTTSSTAACCHFRDMRITRGLQCHMFMPNFNH